MCLYPRLIKNKKYTPNKKNGGIIPSVSDKRVLVTPIGCGKCIECKRKKSREWQVRLLEEVRHDKIGKFVTLTFSNESYKKLAREHRGLKGYDLDNAIATTAVRRFLERWRKKFKKSVKHWLVTELGHNGTENIHLHGIIWTQESREEVANIWNYGYIWPRYDKDWKNNYVSEKTVNYITKYITKTDLHHKLYNSKILTSSGIGKQYIDRSDAKRKKYIPNKTEEYYTTRTGHKMAMPIYWRNKIWSDEEKEKLWIEKLNKQERWVDGQKIDISKGMKEYYKALKIARDKNKRLGYGSLEDWKYEDYEKKQRWLKQQERLKNTTVSAVGELSSQAPTDCANPAELQHKTKSNKVAPRPSHNSGLSPSADYSRPSVASCLGNGMTEYNDYKRKEQDFLKSLENE